jgi:hypothetical protein
MEICFIYHALYFYKGKDTYCLEADIGLDFRLLSYLKTTVAKRIFTQEQQNPKTGKI